MKTLIIVLALSSASCVFQSLSEPGDVGARDMRLDATPDASADFSQDIPTSDLAEDFGDETDMGLSCSSLEQTVCGLTYTCGAHQYGDCAFDCGAATCDATCVDTACVQIQTIDNQPPVNLGSPVGINRDWVIVGLPLTSSVRLINRQTRQNTDLTDRGDPADQFGAHIAVGGVTTAVIAAPGQEAIHIINNLGAGEEPVLGQSLRWPSSNSFGSSVAIAQRTENVIVIGAVADRVAYIANRTIESWVVDQRTELVPPTDQNSGFGEAVALNPNGDRVVVGAPRFRVVYLFAKTSGGSWVYASAADEGGTIPRFGERVVMSDTHVAVTGEDTVVIYRVEGTPAENSKLVHEQTIRGGGGLGSGLAFQYAETGMGDLYIGAPRAAQGGSVERWKRVLQRGWFPITLMSGKTTPFGTSNFGASLGAYGSSVVIGAPSPDQALSRTFEVRLQR